MAYRIASSLIVVVLSAWLTGCTCSNDLTTPREVEPTTRSHLRVVHASVDTPELHCKQNDKDLLSGILYGHTPTEYKQLPSELRNLRFFTGSGAALLSVNVALTADRKHTFVVLDRMDRVRGVLLDDTPPTMNPGSAFVRIVHADDAHRTITITSGSEEQTISFPQVSEWIEVDPNANVDIIVDPSTTITLPSSLLTSGSATTAIIRPQDGPGDALVVLPNN